jgi:Domain of unknown function (DUF892)
MADLNERDTKLVQYLNEALGKEKELETALQAHIEMMTRAPYRERLQQHLKETRGHARDVEQLTKAVARSEVPSDQRNGGRRRSSSRRRRSSTAKSRTSATRRARAGSRS